MSISYAGKKVLITGGLGFLGSNLAAALAEQGAAVTLVDIMLEGHGGNLFNIAPIETKVQVNFCDIRDRLAMPYLIRGKDVVFHLAGQVNHLASIRDPLEDFSINVVGTINVLEAIRTVNPEARFIFSGTRGQYGAAVNLPVDEKHPTRPQGIYGISNQTAENIIQVYNREHGLSTVALRITNTFGPRHQMKHDEYGVCNWFIRRALDDEAIRLFGNGRIVRDYLFIDDTVDALLRAGAMPEAVGKIFNVSSGKGMNFIELAELVVKTLGSGRTEFAEMPRDRAAIEPGDYVGDNTLIKTTLGFEPHDDMAGGILKTAEYYRKHKEHYW